VEAGVIDFWEPSPGPGFETTAHAAWCCCYHCQLEGEKMGNGTSPGTAPAPDGDVISNSRIYGFTGYEFEIGDTKYTVRRSRGETVIVKSVKITDPSSATSDRLLTIKDEHLPALVTALQGIMK
jgi:hypothetical protein